MSRELRAQLEQAHMRLREVKTALTEPETPGFSPARDALKTELVPLRTELNRATAAHELASQQTLAVERALGDERLALQAAQAKGQLSAFSVIMALLAGVGTFFAIIKYVALGGAGLRPLMPYLAAVPALLFGLLAALRLLPRKPTTPE